MEFKGPYLFAMREQDPKMFMELRRSGKMDEHLQEKTEEAYKMLDDLTAKGTPRREAEEIVRATLIEFPTPE